MKRIILAVCVSLGMLVVGIPEAGAVDQPIGQTVFQSAFSGCKVQVEGRNNGLSANYNGSPANINGPSMSFTLLSANQGNITCTGIRWDYVVSCPSLFFLGWVRNFPEPVTDITTTNPIGRTFYMPFFIAPPTCVFVGMWIELRGGPYGRICQVYSLFSGWAGDPCTGHGTPTVFENPYNWYYNPA